MADPVVGITSGVPTSGTGTITTLGQVVAPQGANTATGESGTSGPIRGPLAQGATVTSNPTYTNGTVNPLTTDTAGNLRAASRVTDGTNTATVKAASTAPVAGDSALVVGIHPSSINTNGQNTMANSAPVVIASNQSAVPTQGDIAAGSTDAGNPVKIGGVARTSNPTAVTNGQRVNGMFDKLGKQVAVGALRDVKGVQKTSISANTETTVVTAGAAGVLNDVYAIIITNKSATSVFVDFKDSTGGTVRMTLAAPANDTRGFTVPVDSAMVQATAANNWTATASAAVTSLEITMLYVSNT